MMDGRFAHIVGSFSIRYTLIPWIHIVVLQQETELTLTKVRTSDTVKPAKPKLVKAGDGGDKEEDSADQYDGVYHNTEQLP